MPVYNPFGRIQPLCPNTTTIARLQPLLPEYNHFSRIQPLLPKHNDFFPNITTMPDYNHFCPKTTNFAPIKTLCPKSTTFARTQTPCQIKLLLPEYNNFSRKQPLCKTTTTKQHKESKHEPTAQAHNYKATTTVQPTNRDNNKNRVNRNEKANKAHTHQTFAPRQDTDFPRSKYTYEELVSQLRILTTKYKLHYEYAEAMKLRVHHREPPQNLLITKHSPFPLPPHFQSHWDKILTNTSNDLCNLIRKHHEEERDILETKINHLTSR